jgi:DNA-binding transcriptional ArsR family regulator
MRSLSTPADPLYQPLDTILGTQGAVRVLRVLSRRGSVLSTGTIASRARINRAGAGRTLARLVTAGVVEVVGQGRYVSYRLDPEHPFAADLVKMFRREVERVEGLLELVRSGAEAMGPPPLAVWLLGPPEDAEAENRVDLVLVESEEAADAPAQFRNSLEEYGGRWGLEISLSPVTPRQIRRWIAERSRLWNGMEERAVPVYGAAVRSVVLEA